MHMKSKPIGIGQWLSWLAALTVLLTGAQAAQAATVGHNNLADLMQHSEAIVIGQVKDLRDGFDSNGVPYTEVTLELAERIRGKRSGEENTFTFRQFGLLEPRTMADGRVNVNLTPDGWSQYGLGEEVVLFLSHPARLTGLRTTVGLQQGKVPVRNGRIRLQGNNAGLFQELKFSGGLLGTEERQLLEEAEAMGEVSAREFIKLLRRADRENWVNNGRMKHEG